MIYYITALNNAASTSIGLGSCCQLQSRRQTWNPEGRGQGRHWFQLLTQGGNPHVLHVLRTSGLKSIVTLAILK